jgi:hypothetical protein
MTSNIAPPDATTIGLTDVRKAGPTDRPGRTRERGSYVLRLLLILAFPVLFAVRTLWYRDVIDFVVFMVGLSFAMRTILRMRRGIGWK